MLTSDLLRVRIRKDRVYPSYLDVGAESALAKATELVDLFLDSCDGPRAAVDRAVDNAIGHGTDYLIWRGLAKLLYDRSEFETRAAAEPAEIRRVVFEHAAALGPVDGPQTRATVLAKAAADLGITPEGCESGLYADLEERQILATFKKLKPLALLQRYNLALAQAVLYRAVTLRIRLTDLDPNKLRYLFQTLKFHRLMHRAYRRDDGYLLVVDGPASLLKRSRKYGLQMAMFLPALLHLSDWELRAELDWRGDGATQEFALSPEDGLQSHYRARGQWVADEERWFEQRFDKKDTGWQLERRGHIVELDDNEVIIPDYVLTAPDGREVLVEIVGFWRLAYLQRRIDRLVHASNTPLVLVVSERLKTDRDKLRDAPAQVVFFKGVILGDKVIEAASAALTRLEA